MLELVSKSENNNSYKYNQANGCKKKDKIKCNLIRNP